ncbi:MAG TPA: Gfo/Idh/MocA family oxidoreductase [Planctomycetota bacterium]|nr:Gfo/Idh/MocA family oxidoreductase [Planctomycetota bacterium]
MGHGLTRRAFLRQAAAGGAGLVLLGGGQAARTYAANDKLNVALIGVGGRGSWFVDQIPKLENVVAMCDVNESKATKAYKAFPDLPKFTDFRVMLDKMGKQIDAVVVPTPDHTHAIISVAAMKAGKHVFTEKPLSRTVHEARAMRLTAEKQKVATQMGNQGSSSGQFRRGVELVHEGALGDIREIYVWNAGGGTNRTERPKGSQPVPPYLKWDLWLGPAAYREFHPEWLHINHWRDFGTSKLGWWGSHSAYLAFMAMKGVACWHADPQTKPRIRVQAEVSEINRLSFPKWEVVHFRLPAREGLPPVTIDWFGGNQELRKKVEAHIGRQLDWGDAGEKRWKEHGGALIVGSKGMLRANEHNGGIFLYPEDKFEGEPKPPQKLPGSQGHERDWLQAARGGTPTLSNFSNTGPYIELLMLGNVATQFKEELEYDPLEGKIVNNAEADAAAHPEYRQGWSL